MDELEAYARASARLTDLEIADAWWPAVVRHLGVLFDRAALVEAADPGATHPGPAAPSPVSPVSPAGGTVAP